MMFSSIASLYRDDGGVLSEAARFTLCVVTVHSFTFVYSFIMEMIKRHNWFEDCILQKPRPEPDASLVHACLIKNLRSHYLLLPLAIYYFVYDAFYYMGMRMDYASWLQVSWETVLKDLFVSLVVNDTGFYWSHRALHIPVLYKAIHKQHHQFKQPVAQASEWAHPIEDLLGNIAPTLGGPFIMGSHMYVMLFWLFLRMWKTLDAHSGYSLPFPISVWHGLPGMLGSDMHDFHHESKEGMDSCFGSMTTFWDWACGTDKTFYRVKMNDSTAATKGGRSNKKNNHNDDPTYGVGLRRSPRKKE